MNKKNCISKEAVILTALGPDSLCVKLKQHLLSTKYVSLSLETGLLTCKTLLIYVEHCRFLRIVAFQRGINQCTRMNNILMQVQAYIHVIIKPSCT
jgi:hypothetical protein